MPRNPTYILTNKIKRTTSYFRSKVGNTELISVGATQFHLWFGILR